MPTDLTQSLGTTKATPLPSVLGTSSWEPTFLELKRTKCSFTPAEGEVGEGYSSPVELGVVVCMGWGRTE